MRKILTVLTAVFLLAGCKGKEKSTLQEEKKDSSVRLSVWTVPFLRSQFETRADAFRKAHDDVDLVITTGTEMESTILDTYLTDPSNAADVFVFAPAQLNDFANAGALVPLDEKADEMLVKKKTEKLSDLQSKGKESDFMSASWQNQLYAFPVAGSDSGNGPYLVGVNSKSEVTDWALALGEYLSVSQQ